MMDLGSNQGHGYPGGWPTSGCIYGSTTCQGVATIETQ